MLGYVPSLPEKVAVGTKDRRERERQGTRQSILDAARGMFVRKGYEATTMRGIADAVEYTPTAIYHHFRNKEALLDELCTCDFGSLAQAFQRIGRVADPFERLAKLGDAYVEFAQTHAMQYQFMFMTPRPEGFTPPQDIKRDDPGEDAYAFLRQTCADMIATGLVRPELNDADTLARMAWGLVHGIVSLPIAKAHDQWVDWGDVRETARLATAALIRGLLKTPRV